MIFLRLFRSFLILLNYFQQDQHIIAINNSPRNHVLKNSDQQTEKIISSNEFSSSINQSSSSISSSSLLTKKRLDSISPFLSTPSFIEEDDHNELEKKKNHNSQSFLQTTRNVLEKESSNIRNETFLQHPNRRRTKARKKLKKVKEQKKPGFKEEHQKAKYILDEWYKNKAKLEKEMNSDDFTKYFKKWENQITNPFSHTTRHHCPLILNHLNPKTITEAINNVKNIKFSSDQRTTKLI